MKEHWVFVAGREANPMICSRAGITIYYMDHEDAGPDLASRVPGLLVLYNPKNNRFRIVRLNDKTGIEVGGAEHFKLRHEEDRNENPDHTD